MNFFYSSGAGNINQLKYIPNSFRMLICGSSGSGKSTLTYRLLLENKLIDYEKLYVYSKSLYQEEYQCLIHGFENELSKKNILRLMNSGELIKTPNQWAKNDSSEDDEHVPTIESVAKGLALAQRKPSNITAEFHSNANDIIDPTELDRSKRNLMLFDDVLIEKQSIIEKYFTRGRSANCNCIYISQNYSILKLGTIRSNANFLMFFKSSPYVIEHLYRTYYSIDNPSITDFKIICKNAWKKKYGFLVIDLSQDYESGNRYRCQLEY